MAKKKEKTETMICPVGQFFMDLKKGPWDDSEFVAHLDRSRIEFLKAIRSLIDDRIDNMEKKRKGRSKKKATKIDVE
jgi:hypothetical protein